MSQNSDSQTQSQPKVYPSGWVRATKKSEIKKLTREELIKSIQMDMASEIEGFTISDAEGFLIQSETIIKGFINQGMKIKQEA